MTAITREMLEGLEMPRDTIYRNSGKIEAQVDIYQMRNGVLTPVRVGFTESVGKVISPFQYLKPDVSQGDLLSPETQWENKQREGYQVIGRVDNSARMANHIDAFRNALIMAIKNVDGVLETRYFPEGNLKRETWEEGNKLLGLEA